MHSKAESGAGRELKSAGVQASQDGRSSGSVKLQALVCELEQRIDFLIDKAGGGSSGLCLVRLSSVSTDIGDVRIAAGGSIAVGPLKEPGLSIDPAR
jgi:hypothetical protein